MWAVWQNGLEVLVCILALRKLYVLTGIDCGLLVDIRYAASQYLIENGGP